MQEGKKKNKCKNSIKKLIKYRKIKRKTEKSAVVLRLDNKEPILYSEESLEALDWNNTLKYEQSMRHFKKDLSETQKKCVMLFRKY